MDRSSRYNDFEWAISVNRFMLNIVGLWPSDRDSRQIVGPKLRQLCSFITIVFVLMIPNLISLIRVWGDMISMINNMQLSLPLTITILKVCIIWYKQEILASLIDMIEGDWMKVKIKEERDVMLRYARITRLIAMCGLFIIVLALIVGFGLPCVEMTRGYITNFTNSGKHLPIPTYYLHDVTKSPQFELTLLAQIVATSMNGISYSAIDNLFGLLVFHVCGQLENLYLRLTHMKKYLNYNEILKYNVQDHIRLIRSIEIIDDTFNLMLLGTLLYFAGLFCLQGFLIIFVINQKDQLSVTQFGWFVITIVALCSHMCLYCAVGEILVTR
ncbi:uncharacterized protein LOC116848890 [Odontomachus brunneus]|uniref:uncharacterized protein LOC116848890 n=1 Tax=Odontomachus brunneus TaxID=486640 RepID=UPI0013F256EE|nr:uncharacterized protein LOC116848890 [Odontomachus brunneus]